VSSVESSEADHLADAKPAAEVALDAIRLVAVNTTVAREKLLLQRLKAVQAQFAVSLANRKMPVSELEGQAGTPSLPPAISDRDVSFLKGRLDSMLSVLEKDVASASQGLSLALKFADTDGDGEISEVELRDALARLGGGQLSDEAAAALISRLDGNGDGDVTVKALERYLDKFSIILAKAEERKGDLDGSGMTQATVAPSGLPG
jgi:hypothetical protein